MKFAEFWEKAKAEYKRWFPDPEPRGYSAIDDVPLPEDPTEVPRGRAGMSLPPGLRSIRRED